MLKRADERRILKRCRKDPAFFATEVLGHRLWSKQVEILEAVRDHPRVAVRSCHGAGKTFTAADVVLWFVCCFSDSIIVTTAPTDRQVRRALWQEIRRSHTRARYPLGGELLQTELKIADKWFAFGFSTDDPDAFQGLHAKRVLVVFDEASGVAPGIWDAADGSLTGSQDRFLCIGNPTDPKGRFADECKQPDTRKIAISAFDTPNLQDDSQPFQGLVTRDWVDARRNRWGEDSPLWVSRVLGQFPETSTDGLIPLAWIEQAQNRSLEPTTPNELGVDVARFGDDSTSIYHRKGPVLRCIGNYHGLATTEVTGRVVQALIETGADDAKVDEIGIGAGVVDSLVEQGRPVTGVNVGEGAKDRERFANLRAEVFWGLRERFEVGDIDLDPTDEVLAAELAGLKYKIDSRGRIQLEKKEDMKKRLPNLGSPDRADAAALAFAQAEPPFVVL